MAHPLNRPTSARPYRAAFTLIELLVVVSIIALLIGILLPTLGEARRQAGIVACVATIRSNSQGVASYTADNKDRLPTTPEGNGGTSGVVGKPAINVAGRLNDGPLNGWSFTVAERPNGLQYWTDSNTNIATKVGVEAFWFIPFGNYMSETRGDAMLQEPFVSPTDRSTQAVWNAYRTVPRGDRIADVEQPGMYLEVPTYWYVLPALYTQRTFDLDGPLNSAQSGTTPISPQQARGFNRASTIQFTSSKVAFYQYVSTHDRGIRTFWNNIAVNDGNGPSISITMFDGSAKNVKVADESQVIQPRDDQDQDAGPTLSSLPGTWHTPYFNGPGPQYFRFTFGGLSGRDLP